MYRCPMATSDFFWFSSFSNNYFSLIIESFLFLSLLTFSKAFCKIAFSPSYFYNFQLQITLSLKSFLNFDMINFIYCSVRKLGNQDIFGMCFYSDFSFSFSQFFIPFIGLSSGLASGLFSLFGELSSSVKILRLIYFRIQTSPSYLMSKPSSNEKYKTFSRDFSIFYNIILIGFNYLYLSSRAYLKSMRIFVFQFISFLGYLWPDFGELSSKLDRKSFSRFQVNYRAKQDLQYYDFLSLSFYFFALISLIFFSLNSSILTSFDLRASQSIFLILSNFLKISLKAISQTPAQYSTFWKIALQFIFFIFVSYASSCAKYSPTEATTAYLF